MRAEGVGEVACPDCAAEYLLALSCKGRGLCPSCGAKRAAEFAASREDEMVADVAHAQWVFTVPKLLRTYVMHLRQHLGALCTAARQTVHELMAVAADEEKGIRPGLVAMYQTVGDQLNLYPHVHALVTRGGWTASGEWLPVPCVSSSAAEQLFRHDVMSLHQPTCLLDEDSIGLLLSWHHSGFGVHNTIRPSRRRPRSRDPGIGDLVFDGRCGGGSGRAETVQYALEGRCRGGAAPPGRGITEARRRV